MLDRRSFLGTGGIGALALGFAPRIAFARAATDKRLVFIIQRGAADGLSMLAPVADPGFAAARGALATAFQGLQTIQGMFALHPEMKNTAALFAGRQALFVHATASAYRERSHFDGQNVLETGGSGPFRLKDGWLNRLLSLLPAEEARAIAVSATVPLALRGTHEVGSYAPSALPPANGDLLQRVAMLYQGDPQLHALWSEAMNTRALTADLASDTGRNAAAMGGLAARLMAPADGARIAMIDSDGWDTHSGQERRLASQLAGLDAMIGALKAELGPLWAQTLVLVATEFGRTVAINGTGGTDHGTASAAMLLGGAVKGGRVIADWPGLGQNALYEGRDLRPTTALDAVIGGAVAGHFALEPARAMATLFPGSAAKGVTGLV
ncbi:MAG: DUF1501 domain-containing protein [Sphingomonas sp.]|jgi:uncharacterized protein (DUF1501 family)